LNGVIVTLFIKHPLKKILRRKSAAEKFHKIKKGIIF